MTHAQKQASNPEYSVWVAASAGTGKTKVLTDRVLRLLLSGINPSKILCLTFTKAAAAEMSNRINKELKKWVLLDEAELEAALSDLHFTMDNDLKQHARTLFARVLDTPDGLKIQTIHSFCQMLMRRFPLEAGIAPHFQVIEEQTSKELLQESWTRLITHDEHHSEEVARAIKHISGSVHEGSLNDLMKELVKERGQLTYLWDSYGTLGVIDKVYETLGVLEYKQSSPYDTLLDQCTDSAFNFAGLKAACQDLLASTTKTSLATGQKITNWLSASKEERCNTFSNYTRIFLTTDDQPKATKSMFTKDVLQVEEVILKEQQRIFAITDTLKSLTIARQTESLLHVAEALLEIYRRAKESRAFLDYNDLILASGKLLRKTDVAPWVLYKLDGGIDHILIDEAQDTSPEQWAVIEAICEDFFSGKSAQETGRTLFVVGDEKQSIFSFQGADPKEFGRMHSYFKEKVTNAEKEWHSVSLDRSFRSTEPILKCVDTVFSNSKLQSMVTSSDDIIRHESNRVGSAGCVELWPLIEKEEAENLQPWEPPTQYKQTRNAKKILVEKITSTIQTWLNQKRILKSKGRPITPGDIMILVRRRNDFVDMMVKSLKKADIPVAGIDRMVITDHLAVMDLIALGQFLLLPQDDLNCAVVLKTPFIGLSEDELFDLAHNRGKTSLWDRLKQKKDETIQYRKAFDYLSSLLSKTDFITPFDLYSYILEALEGRKQCISRMGSEVNDPINEFLSLALQYENNHPPSLQGFLHWITVGTTEIKRDLDQGRDEIRIMTVHGSKGLQAPIIFLPDTTQTPKSNHSVLWSDDRLLFWPAGKDNENQWCQELKEKNKQHDYEEYIRLLYVALTRAGDELYITGYKGDQNISDNCWYQIVKDALSGIAKEQDEILRIDSEQTALVTASDGILAANDDAIQLPKFATTSAPEEPTPTQPLTPSKPEHDDPSVQSPLQTKNILRGTLIHKLLEYLPDVDIEKRQPLANRFIDKHSADFDTTEQQEILSSVFSILEDEQFAPIFGPGSKAEVPIAGTVDDYVISGQIDRLLIKEDKVLIIDYKTGRTPPEKPENIHPNYKKQMAMYKAALQKIYPNKEIECAIIWTEVPLLMVVE